MSGIFIAGTGMYVPKQIVSNDDMAKIVDTSDEWIRQRTGIRERRFSTGEPNYYMGKMAALQAMKNAGVTGAEIDAVIGCTITPDYFYPSLACIIQDEIGAENAFCWDLNAACSGYIYALDVARNYLAMGSAKNILIVCSEEMSKVMDFTDRSSCVLFGDGAAATVVRKGDGMYASYLRSEGKLGGAILSRALRTQGRYVTDADNPAYAKYPQTKGHYLTMAGGNVYRFAVTRMPEAVREACKKAGISVDDLKLIVPHQANIRIIRTAAERLGVSMDKMAVNVDRYGNMSCVTIPMCLAELDASGKLKRGDRIALVGFGAGLTYGGIVMEW